jgi:hypothetical protein
MHGQLKRKRSAFWENGLILLGALVALVIVRIADKSGMPKRWHAAVLGTIVPFLTVVWFYRARWSRWSLWAALTVCLLIHLSATWILFQFIMANVQNIGLLLWFPVAFVESFALLLVVTAVENLFLGKRGNIKVS